MFLIDLLSGVCNIFLCSHAFCRGGPTTWAVCQFTFLILKLTIKFHLCIPFRVTGANIQQSLYKGQGTTWTGHKSREVSETNKTTNHSLTHRVSIELRVNLTVMFKVCGRKPECPKKIHDALRERANSTHKGPQPGFNSATFLLRGNSSTNWATASPQL